MPIPSRKIVFASFGALLALTPAAANAQAAPAAAGGRPLASPIGNPGDWFPPDAYPPEAKAAGLQGRTAFQLDIDPKGRITSCNITSSSGSPLLDSTTCALLVTNARFAPAHDASGNAVPGAWNSAMVWKLTAAAPELPEGIAETGISPAEAYNQSLTDEAHAAAAAQDQSQSQSQGQGDDQ
ncbi:MAG TPA: energy transducer TonB [Sphingomonas sp.]|nr:energy transducer TonB [Sphingomonas sp.]